MAGRHQEAEAFLARAPKFSHLQGDNDYKKPLAELERRLAESLPKHRVALSECLGPFADTEVDGCFGVR
jgi:hypothetical protein